MASQYKHALIVGPNQTQTLFTINGPGRLRNLLLAANPYAAYTIVDTNSQAGPWLSYPFPVPASQGNVVAGALQPALLVELFASPKQQTYSGLAASAQISFNTSDWAGSIATDANGNVILENFYLNPPQGWPFAGYLVVSVTGIANVQTSVSASIMAEVI